MPSRTELKVKGLSVKDNIGLAVRGGQSTVVESTLEILSQVV